MWIALAELRKVRREARKLLPLSEEERKEREKKLLDKLYRLNINAKTLDDVLSLTAKDFLERRLQTLVYRKGLAKTIKQARQLIVHGFIAIDGVKQVSPGRLVRRDEEEKIGYYKPINLEKYEEKEEQGEENKEVKEEKEKQSPQKVTENQGGVKNE